MTVDDMAEGRLVPFGSIPRDCQSRSRFGLSAGQHRDPQNQKGCRRNPAELGTDHGYPENGWPAEKKRSGCGGGLLQKPGTWILMPAKRSKKKRLDMIAANLIGPPDSGFAADTNRMTLFFADGRKMVLDVMDKDVVARPDPGSGLSTDQIKRGRHPMTNATPLVNMIRDVRHSLRHLKQNGCTGFDCSSETLKTLAQLGMSTFDGPAGQETLADIRADLGDCTRCPLCHSRTHIVFGEGNPNAGLVFVGEGPGFDEDQSGHPFVGAAGQLLTKIIEAMNLSREMVYISNIVKCRPPGNRQSGVRRDPSLPAVSETATGDHPSPGRLCVGQRWPPRPFWKPTRQFHDSGDSFMRPWAYR